MYSPKLYFHSHGSSGYFSLVLFLTPARIPDNSPLYLLSSRRTSRTCWKNEQSQYCQNEHPNLTKRSLDVVKGSGRVVSVVVVRTWPFLRILARLNFSLCLTRGLRSIFFLLGVSPLFLAICWVHKKKSCNFKKELREILKGRCIRVLLTAANVPLMPPNSKVSKKNAAWKWNEKKKSF